MEAPKKTFSKREVWRAVNLSTFVSVGNATQKFNRLVEGVLVLADKLSHPLTIQHGNTQRKDKDKSVIWIDFISMESFSQKIIESEILILHAGAGSLIHAIEAGKIPVVMPRRVKYREHIDDHQLEFAIALEEEEMVVIAMEPEDIESAMYRAIDLQKIKNSRTREGPPRLLSMVRDALLS